MQKYLWATVVFAAVAALAVGYYLLVANAPQKTYRIGILSGNDTFLAMADGFKEKMTELKYIEGKNISYDFQKDSNNDRIAERAILKKFVADKVDLMFVFPTEPALESKEVTKDNPIPVVFAHVGLEGSDLVRSIRAPGGNLTGTRFPGPELVEKRFELLLELVPSIKNIYIPYDKNYPNANPALTVLRPAAAARGVNLVECPVATLSELKTCISDRDRLPNIDVDAILLMPEVLTASTDGWKVINDFAKKHRLPLVGSSDRTTKIGGLFSYNVNPAKVGAMAALIADKILRGTKPAIIPVETPDAYLLLNLTTATELGIKPSDSFLAKVYDFVR